MAANGPQGASSLATLQAVSQLLTEMFPGHTTQQPPHVRLRFNLDGDVRVLDIPADARLHTLYSFLEQRYATPLLLSTETLNGELEPIVSQAVLERLVARALDDHALSVLVVLTRRDPAAPLDFEGSPRKVCLSPSFLVILPCSRVRTLLTNP